MRLARPPYKLDIQPKYMDWEESLRNGRIQRQLWNFLYSLEYNGHVGNARFLGDSVYEANRGDGLNVYFAISGGTIFILDGGHTDKSARDRNRILRYWNENKEELINGIS